MSSVGVSISVVICTSGRLPELARCLDALGTLPDTDELLLVASGCNAAALHPFTSSHAARVLQAERGLSRARNAGAAAARCTVVAYLDDDAVPTHGWLEHVRRAFADPQIAAACGPVLPLEAAAPGEPVLPANANRIDPYTVDRGMRDWVWVINFGGVVTGSNMAVRRSLFARHRFHHALGRGARIEGGEEHYFFYEVVRDGGTVRYDPAIAIRHHLPAGRDAPARAVARRSRAVTAYLGFLLLHEPAARASILRHIARWLVTRRSRADGLPAPRPRLRGLADLLRSGTARR